MAEENKPGFLKGVKLTRLDIEKFDDEMSNWAKFHPYMKTYDEDTLLKALQYEVLYFGRSDLLGRLKRRYDTVRSERELTQLMKVANT